MSFSRSECVNSKSNAISLTDVISFTLENPLFAFASDQTKRPLSHSYGSFTLSERDNGFVGNPM